MRSHAAPMELLLSFVQQAINIALVTELCSPTQWINEVTLQKHCRCDMFIAPRKSLYNKLR